MLGVLAVLSLAATLALGYWFGGKGRVVESIPAPTEQVSSPSSARWPLGWGSARDNELSREFHNACLQRINERLSDLDTAASVGPDFGAVPDLVERAQAERQSLKVLASMRIRPAGSGALGGLDLLVGDAVYGLGPVYIDEQDRIQPMSRMPSTAAVVAISGRIVLDLEADRMRFELTLTVESDGNRAAVTTTFMMLARLPHDRTALECRARRTNRDSMR